jgi:tetratricopeptide (TPR) repeat protein
MSSRARVYVTVAAIAAAAAAVAVAVAWTGRAEPELAAGTVGGPRAGVPPLALDVVDADPAIAAALRSAASLYEGGQQGAALQAFEDILEREPGSLEAAVGAAFARWPDGTLGQLAELERSHPESALVSLHTGLALLWNGDGAGAQNAWRQAEERDPDSPSAVRAESLLHPEMPAGRPFFVPSRPLPADLAGRPPAEQLAALRRRAEEGNDQAAWLALGVALQRAGHPVSAQEAFDRAVSIDPDDPEAQTAAAVVRFDKDDPSQAFSRLGPLSSSHPGAAVVRFHLGLALLWLRDLDDARSQLEAAVASEPGTIYAREAATLLEELP